MSDFDESKVTRDERGRFSSGMEGFVAKHTGRYASALVSRAEATGGFSYRPGASKANRTPTDGFMVSHDPKAGFGHVIEIEKMAMRDPPPSRAELREEIKSAVKDWLAKSMTKIQGKDDHYLGGWFERNEDGTPKALHLDVSQHFPSKEKAVAAGRERNQLAIWDVKNKAEIDTGGTGR